MMISEIKDELVDMLITLGELEVLEDFDGVDYSAVCDELKWSHQQLKHRLLSLQMRGDDDE